MKLKRKRKFKYVLVDELQDVNTMEADIALGGPGDGHDIAGCEDLAAVGGGHRDARRRGEPGVRIQARPQGARGIDGQPCRSAGQTSVRGDGFPGQHGDR